MNQTILFLAANPSEETRLALTKEARDIDSRLQYSKHRDQFEIKQFWEVKASEVPTQIMRHNPTIVHFSGHGSPDGELIFQDVDGRGQPIRKELIARIFSIVGGAVKIVVLNACFSEEQAQLIAEHIDVVIGMSDAIPDKSAIAFASSFYEYLGFGKSVADAFEGAKLALDIEELSGSDLPQLIIRNNANPKSIVLTEIGLSSFSLQISDPIDFIKRVPNGPKVDFGYFEQEFLNEYASYAQSREKAFTVILKANNLCSKAAGVALPNSAKILPGEIPAMDLPILFWQNLFLIASLKGPKMVAAITLAIPDEYFEVVAKQQRDLLLSKLSLGKGNLYEPV